MSLRFFGSVLLIALLTACGSGKGPKPPAPGVKLGKPYSIYGTTYTPEYDPHYDEIGLASWYGPGFHGKKTANGEVFDQDDLTAAHTTLPMPSLVRVTNLGNGKSIVVRINDRGPFKDSRIIDLSKGSAHELDIHGKGIQRVRVQYLKEETDQYWASMNLTSPPTIRLAGKEVPLQNEDSPDTVTTVTTTVTRVEPAASANAPQVSAAAPLMSVSEQELPPAYEAMPSKTAEGLRPELLKVRPIEPRFRVISDAEASEKKSMLTSHSLGAPPSNLDEQAPRQFASAEPPKKPFGAPSPRPLKENTDAPVGLDNAGPGWYVQVGSFSSADNAHSVARKLAEAGSAQVKEISVNGKSWNRVRVGPIRTRDDAEIALEKVTDLGIEDARIVKE